ncbi:MAG: Molybdenum cofactor biosysynthesis protein [Microbacteriaceae bacterium]|nr:Molybdenum cofactor biosysynthesis protein [Microbacteriaceae bacterium]
MFDLPFSRRVEIVLLLASATHRYEGRPADGPAESRGIELHDRVEVRAGLGILGDRFFGQRAHRQASVTVMAAESLDAVERELGLLETLPLEAPRRNIMLRGVAADELRGVVFSLDTGDGPVVFQGHRPASPCAWMNVTLAPGAHKALRGRGGVRCEPLTSGTLRRGAADLRTAVEVRSAVEVPSAETATGPQWRRGVHGFDSLPLWAREGAVTGDTDAAFRAALAGSDPVTSRGFGDPARTLSASDERRRGCGG